MLTCTEMNRQTDGQTDIWKDRGLQGCSCPYHSRYHNITGDTCENKAFIVGQLQHGQNEQLARLYAIYLGFHSQHVLGIDFSNFVTHMSYIQPESQFASTM